MVRDRKRMAPWRSTPRTKWTMHHQQRERRKELVWRLRRTNQPQSSEGSRPASALADVGEDAGLSHTEAVAEALRAIGVASWDTSNEIALNGPRVRLPRAKNHPEHPPPLHQLGTHYFTRADVTDTSSHLRQSRATSTDSGSSMEVV